MEKETEMEIQTKMNPQLMDVVQKEKKTFKVLLYISSVPQQPGGYNLNVSFITALKYGRSRISSSFTIDFFPT
ncbi:hypothetical protein H5410_049244 [Solanum commersonii]|uniref:Uncharacterized protein n=1 Tax=Solanum commersonii TaxID=4109 RepID=A0A9J5XLY8_SOLCO|nr:hypothetical protein H5410_049244 [Solanum commersonii]